MKVEFLNRNDGHGMIMRVNSIDLRDYKDDEEFESLRNALKCFYRTEFPFEKNECKEIYDEFMYRSMTAYVYFTHLIGAEIYSYDEFSDTYRIFSPLSLKGKTGKGEIPE